MKPARFDYYDPTTLAEALSLLAQFGDTAKPLAGGQSLVPMMNMRLARPAQLVDLNRLGELNYLKVEQGELRIGAMTRQRVLERSEIVARGWPLLPEAARYIGHVQIRNRGTVGGSLVHAYPSAELPVVMTALDATLVLRSEKGERVVRAEEFFVDVMTTVLQPGELLVEVRVPQVPPGSGASFQEVSRRHGDFALMGVAAIITPDAKGNVGAARLVFTGAIPVRSRKAEELLIGKPPDRDLFGEAARVAATALDPESDVHASAEYRKEVAAVLGRRVLEQAANRAFHKTGH
ncbi:MAG: xanthine dehydrogenase family protein subunit M [Candidatus Binatia bacterium]